MKKKSFKAAPSKINKIEQFYAHFGWKTELKEGKRLTMTFDKKQRNGKILKKLQKQATIIRKKFPSRMIGWAIVGAIFLVPYFFLKDGVLFGVLDLKTYAAMIPISWAQSLAINFLPILLMVIGGINAMFAAYELLAFIFLKITSKATLEEIYRNADAMSGNVIDAPLRFNIAEDNKNSGVLAAIDIKNI